ncbi:MAG: beta-CASP ribonuclease aCPSF1 [Candidatus Micrarchaeia archaeon]
MENNTQNNNQEKKEANNGAELLEKLKEILPKEAEIIKAVYEGPDIAVYARNVSSIYGNEALIKNASSAIKKKLIIRSDPSKLMDQQEAEKRIRKIIPEEAGIPEDGIKFAEQSCEVYIEAEKPGIAIGKGGSTLIRIVEETNWIPKILRVPTMHSEVISGIRQLMVKEQDFRQKFLLSLGKKINLQNNGQSEWIKATALGGFREVGRSSLLIETNHSKVLIDCGISPEPAVKGVDAITGDTNKVFPYLDTANITINDIDAVILTHAHLDHTGFVPYLFKYGYEGPVYCTPPTRDLTALVLYDYIKLVQKSGGTPLYDEKDVKKMLMHTITRDYGEVTNVTNEIKLTYHNAGHILGSATVHLHIGEGMYNIVHTGDFKYGYTRLLDEADTRYPRVDALFMESTYGGSKDIPIGREEAEYELMEFIKKTLEGNGKVLIPVLSVGRGQELMLILEAYMKNNPRYNFNVPVYLDGMILEASAIHTAYPEYLKYSLRRRILSNNSPFESEIFQVAKGEMTEVLEKGPAIILASGGMLNGGTSLEYFKQMADDPKNAIVFVNYTSVNSIARRVQNGLKEIALPDESGKLKPISINLQVKTVDAFSGHSNRLELVNFADQIRPSPKKIFTMHGEEYKCEDLARYLGIRKHVEARAPMNLDTIRLR